MTPACLNDTVALRGCPPTSGASPLYYLDDLPGFSFNLIAGLARADNPSAYNYAASLIRQAADIVVSDMTGKAAERFHFRDSVELIVPEPWRQDTSPPNSLPRGIQVKRSRHCGRLTCLHIESLQIATASSHQALTITIQDGPNTLLYEVQGVQAWQPFDTAIDLYTQSDVVRITLPPDVIPLTVTNYKGCGCSNRRSVDDTRCYRLRGWNGVGEETRLYGVQIRGAMACCIETLFCTFKQQAADLIKWRAGMLLATEGFTTERLNPETLGTEKLQTLFGNWQTEYNKRMDNWFNGARYSIANMREECIICNQMQYTYGY